MNKQLITASLISLVIGLGFGGFLFAGNSTPLGAEVSAETYIVKDSAEIDEAIRRVTESKTVIVETDYTLLQIDDDLKAINQKIGNLTRELAEANAEKTRLETLKSNIIAQLRKR